MTVIDLIALAIVALSCVMGLMRGFVREAMSLAGWLLAFYGARSFAPEVGAWLPGIEDASLRYGAALVLIFVTVLLAASLLALLMRGMVNLAGLGAYDKMVGAAFGALRAVLILLVLSVVAGLSALPKTQAWQASWSHTWLESAVLSLKPWLPQELAVLIQFQ
ncbi:MAG: CvpA family protein [Pseudomonadota bacterium]